jgi:hypothetical protein
LFNAIANAQVLRRWHLTQLLIAVDETEQLPADLGSGAAQGGHLRKVTLFGFGLIEHRTDERAQRVRLVRAGFGNRLDLALGQDGHGPKHSRWAR